MMWDRYKIGNIKCALYDEKCLIRSPKW